jgi:peptidoglycan/LPS O-acetylase OafA/YrhL
MVLPKIGRNNNFNFLRLFFSFSVAIGHAWMSKPESFLLPFLKLFNGHVAVCGFFIISGFLITKSYSESISVKEYFIKRCRRLMPAYCMVVLLCAAGLSLLSDLSPEEYFTSPQLYQYIAANLSFMNFLQPALPGVFMSGEVTKRTPEINGSLWTIRIEVLFYILVPLIVFMLSKFKSRRRINIALISAYILGILYGYLWAVIVKKFNSPLLYDIMGSSGYIPYFVTGIFCLINFDWLQKHLKYLIAPGIIITVLEYIYTFNPVLEIFLPAGLGTVIMFTAFNFSRLHTVGKNGDYSYGIYIFHVPLLKILFDMGYYEVNIYTTVFLGISISFTFAYLSWHLVEKTALKRN